MIECSLCGELVPRETTTYRASDTSGDWCCCCSCLAEYRVGRPDDPDHPFAVFATLDEAWRDLMEWEEIACLAVPIDNQRIPLDAVITFLRA